MSDELRPCAHCGASHWSREDEDSTGLLWVMCVKCGACGPTETSWAEAVAAWNHRALPDRSGLVNLLIDELTLLSRGDELPLWASANGIADSILALLEPK